MVTNFWGRTDAYFDVNVFWKFLKAASKDSILTICFGIRILCQFMQTYIFPGKNMLHIKNNSSSFPVLEGIRRDVWIWVD